MMFACAVLLGLATAAVDPSPWMKYMLAPGPNRTHVPVTWQMTPPGGSPVLPNACSGFLGGTEGEWAQGTEPGTRSAQMTLSCAAGGTITGVDFASFGTPTGTCGSFAKSTCDAAGTREWVAHLCVGKGSCTLPPDATVRDTNSSLVQALGDPCRGTRKQLSVQLSGCAPAVPQAPALPARLQGNGASLLFDFGQNTGGFTTLTFAGASDAAQSVSLAYSESSRYAVGGDRSNGGKGPDGTISTGPIAISSNGTTEYTPSVAHMRGGFRYLNLVLETDGWIDVGLPSVHFTATPNMPDPSAWRNHFYSSDDLLNRIWYASGYTTQMCSIDPAHGRQWPPPASGWNNSASCGQGDSVLVDGAKRDRVIWPGDMGVSSLTCIYTTGDVDASRNSLDTLYSYQNRTADGMLPYAGPPVSQFGGSDTYHLWALLGTYNVAHHDPDDAWLRGVWAGYKRGLAASTAKVSAQTGLFRVDKRADWQRTGQGGENCAANVLYFRALTAGSEMAARIGDDAARADFTAKAAALKAAIMARLWDEAKGAFVDNTNNRALHPQDGNSLAVWFNVPSAAQAGRVSDYLRTNWGLYGSSSPEWFGNVGTFPGSMEVHAHMAAGNATRAHALMRLQWGYMLAAPDSTRSTFWEGYHVDGSFNEFCGSKLYMSHAHGWATGPAAALTQHTLGIRPLARGGATFTVAPRFGGLRHCRGRLSFAAGRHVDAAWNVTGTAITLVVDSSTHTGSSGLVRLDFAEVRRRHSRLEAAVVNVNGARVWVRGRGLAAPRGMPQHGSLAVDAERGVVEVQGVTPQ
eukprot:g5346.t1